MGIRLNYPADPSLGEIALKNQYTLLQLALITLACIISIWGLPGKAHPVFPGIYDAANHKLRLKLGLDLRSGSHIAVQLVPTPDEKGQIIPITEEVRRQTIQVFERRLNPDGTLEIQITPEGLDRLIIEIPEMTDSQKAEAMVQKVAKLEFRQRRENIAKGTVEWVTVLDGKYIKKAMPESNMGNNWVVAFELTDKGADIFGEITRGMVGKPLGIFFDGEPVGPGETREAKLARQPIVQEAILGGRGQISGSFTVEQAQELATYLNSGTLPVNVKVLSSFTVSPTLGKESLDSSVEAFAAGLGIIVLYMIFYYRLPGFCASLALVIYAIITLASMNIPGMEFVLTLPGIAGFILSIGIAVDANVLIFERLKEELWHKKSITNATDTGFARAWSSILDGHVTTFIGAFILYAFGTATVKGFGATLMVGTAWSLITAVYITRQMMDFCVYILGIKSRWLFGE